MAEIVIGPKTSKMSSWSRLCSVDGVEYYVLHEQGKRVRIPYKPRPHNYGFHWFGNIYKDGKRLWRGQVQKSTGARGILKAAGIIKEIK